ncbi:LGFP repeat-containing protein [Kineococcus xinjiangensis]|uniref:LGFP repeat-containing protein n=1 Tax=Kineococcus xinjiangensis TaxID=512762 RepID=A0A2S6IU39_9ACTN|nr:N-acetylmuramoyl-L-alanine amidase [Kineococcus xinjiangensis]PPK97772.1 LGFP repeat-containing protein [Kineococcus xinjiangensis]
MRWTRNDSRTTTEPAGQAAAVRGVSRRLALAAGGSAGVLSLLSPLHSRAATATGSALGPGAVTSSGTTQAYSLADAAVRLAGTDGAAAPAGLAEDTVTVTIAVDGGRMLGVTFPRGTRASEVEVRTGDGRTWDAWTALPLSDNEPDAGSAEARRTVTASDPLWVGHLGAGAQVQVRLPRADVATARLHVVDPGVAAGDARAVRLVHSRRAAAPAAAATPQELSLDTGEEPVAPVVPDPVLPVPAPLAPTAPEPAPVAEEPVSKALAQPRIGSREAWGADETLRRAAAAYSTTIKAAVVHHTADKGSYSQGDVPAVIRGMYRYHTVSQGWSDLGYNFVVDRFGGIWEGRAGGITQAVIGAHAGGFNTDTFGVSMMGDFTSTAPTQAMLESVAQVIAWKLSLYNVKSGGSAQLLSAGGGTSRYKAGTAVTMPVVMAHRDVGFTACPGNTGITKMGWIRNRVDQLLQGAPTSPIAAKYAQSGGRAGSLGGSSGPETKTPGRPGAYQHFQGGSIYWSQATGAQIVKGAIRDRWASFGSENGYLGFPTRDEGPAAAGGAYSHFQGGSIYWSPATGAHVVRGAIRDKWSALGWERSFLGFPTTSEIPLPRGAFNHFQGGSIYWSAATGAKSVRGAIRDAWAAQGWENGRLGYPTSDEYDVSGGRRSDFQGGSLTWHAATGAVTKALK